MQIEWERHKVKKKIKNFSCISVNLCAFVTLHLKSYNNLIKYYALNTYTFQVLTDIISRNHNIVERMKKILTLFPNSCKIKVI